MGLIAIALLAALAGPVPADASFGGDTVGGDDGEAVVVTSLSDSGPGTLREAVGHGDRRITFRVAGAIVLESPLVIRGPRVTIDGSSTPGPGITITSQPVVVQDASDVLVRHLRFRGSDDDNLRISGACENVIVEHCSSTEAGDGAIDVTLDYKTGRRPRKVTIAWCLVAGTDKAMLIQSADRVSLHHNLFTDNAQRNPQLHDVREFDFRNNVVCAWGVYGVRVRAGSSGNVVNNVFERSSNRSKRDELAFIVVGGGSAEAAGPVYASGNLASDAFPADLQGNAGDPLPAPAAATGEAAAPAVVREQAGALPRDDVDARFVAESETSNSGPSQSVIEP
jgi:pectate lyase